eukprot:TRINITY_DN8723_c0_g1_i3.p1 TRINITY_DN8723_c0_g1~~TRINITY_DN8723_c0_g1_i3.p1  ORF type:complete len:711 (-),score=171.69 TRINITY_DN8723_c0_g1_i3:148-2280(-)
MITIKKEVKTEVMEIVDNEEEEEISNPSFTSESSYCGEGGVLVHGRAILSTVDRGDLFSPDLEKKLTSVICNICSQISYNFSAWRTHCLTKHANVPGYTPSLLHSGLSLTSTHFSVTVQTPYLCSRCSRSFPTQDTLEDHKLSEMRTVRLVCPQCKGQFGDLEQHMLAKHGGDKTCAKCDQPWLNTRNQNIRNLVDHHHAEHQGFSSVIAETSSRCAGDGVTIEWFETVLSSEARFLASEVKPEAASEENVQSREVMNRELNFEKLQKMAQAKTSKSVAQPNLLYENNPSDTSGPIITNISGSFPIYARNVTNTEIMTELERHAYNVRSYAKFKDSGMGLSRNECELCGFVPYTKNKYREKQDHLAKFHFKERIEAVLPTSRPYSCPDTDCEYLGKDKQDILRHYTGKHNILKMWVDTFIREQTGAVSEKVKKPLWQADSERLPHKKSGEALTFQEMEVLAIENERIRWKMEKVRRSPDGSPESMDETFSNDSDIIFNTVGQQTSFTISKISKVGGISPRPADSISPRPVTVTSNLVPDTAPSISLIRINKNLHPSSGIHEAQRTPLFVSQTRSEKPPKSPKHEIVDLPSPPLTKSPMQAVPTQSKSIEAQTPFLVKCKFCREEETECFTSIYLWKEHCIKVHNNPGLPSAEPPPRIKHDCDNCNMSFPSQPALRLHMEVCGESEEIFIREDPEPRKKKLKRPPPALIPL